MHAETHTVGPDQNLQRIVDAAEAGDTILLTDGVYRQTVRIRDRKDPLTIAAAEGATPVFDGRDPVPGPWKKEEGGVYSAPWDADPIQLFDGQRMLLEARWPNIRFSELLDREKAFSTADHSTHGRITDKDLAEAGFDATGATAILSIAHQFWTWTRPVTTHKPGTAELGYPRITVGLGGRAHNRQWDGNWYALRGSEALLDAPGEWLWRGGRLRVIPIDGRVPDGVRAKKRTYAVRAKGVADLTIRGIEFRACTIDIEASENCTVEGCRFYFPVAIRDIAEEAEQAGRSPMTLLDGVGHTVRDCVVAFSPAAGLKLTGSRHAVEDCWIHHVNWYGTLRYCGLSLFGAGDKLTVGERNAGNHVRYCLVEQGGNALVSVSAQADSSAGYCHIRDGGMACKDVSLLYTQYPSVTGTRFHHNWVHGCHTPHIALGIRGDDQTRGLTVDHNVVWDCSWEGILVKGDGNRIAHNTCFDNGTGKEAPVKKADLLLFGSPEPRKPWRNGQAPLLDKQNANSEVLRNAVARMVSGRKGRGKDQMPGRVEGNVIGDIKPMLVGPEHMDFRPKPDSELVGRTDTPDVGAYEHDVVPWTPGPRWDEARWKAERARVERLRW